MFGDIPSSLERIEIKRVTSTFMKESRRKRDILVYSRDDDTQIEWNLVI